MGRFVKGDLVVLPFPYSDLSGVKRRPAVVLADAGGNDLVLCQMSSTPDRSGESIKIEQADLARGKINRTGWARPSKLFTGDSRAVAYKLAELNQAKLNEIIDAVVYLLKR